MTNLTPTGAAARAKPLPSVDELRKVFVLDANSPSHLRYVATNKLVLTKTEYGYYKAWMRGHRFSAHRIVWALAHGELPPPHMEVDHINGERADNRPQNLRLCTSAENHQNMVYEPGRLQGVTYCSRRNIWASSIQVRGDRIFLGHFTTAEEGHAAYLDAKRKFHEFNPMHRGAAI